MQHLTPTCLLTVLVIAPLAGQAGGKFGGRPAGNQRLARSAPDVAKAIRDGLAWLAAHQNEDGSFDAATFMQHDAKEQGRPSDGIGVDLSPVGTTALSLLAFLGDGHTTRQGEHRECVAKALAWFGRQQDENGTFRGMLPRNAVTEQAVATWAVTEAALLSQEATEVAQPAVDALAGMANGKGLWSRNRETAEVDLLATLWATCAMRTAVDMGISDPAPLAGIAKGLRDATRTDGTLDGREKTAALSASPRADLAAGVFCRFMLGENPAKSEPMRACIERLQAASPAKVAADDAEPDLLFWCIGSYALFQAGGKGWRDWSEAVMPALVRAQRKEGSAKGSWDPVGRDAKAGGRVYATVLGTLTLQTYYRYTRLVR